MRIINYLNNYKKADEIVNEAINIGDVTTIEGKRKFLMFILKLHEISPDDGCYTVCANLEGGISGLFTSYFSDNVWKVVEYAFEQFKRINNPPTYDYYFKNKSNSKIDAYDVIIGNTLYNLRVGVHFGQEDASRLMNMRVESYLKFDEVLGLEESCKELVDYLKGPQKELK